MPAAGLFAFEKIPTLIKIDVEGYEQNVLNGAESMIKAYQPVLAVAIYHKERDFWEIPLKIKENIRFIHCLSEAI